MTKRLSASQLNKFLGCEHQAALWLADAEASDDVDDMLILLRDKGMEHEGAVLARLEREYGAAVRVPGNEESHTKRQKQTLEAMQAGAPLIYQGAFATERWVGYPDFLIRREQSESGRWRYEAEDAKLARKAKPEHVIQLGIYAHLLDAVAGVPIGAGAIHVAVAEPERFDLRETRYAVEQYRRTFEAFADQDLRKTKGVPCSACGECPFNERCEAEWRAADSSVFVAGIGGTQVKKLEKAGINTLTELAGLGPATKVVGIGSETLLKYVAQADAQKRSREQGKLFVELLEPQPGRGFHLLPPPDDGDLFFDMEGDPLFEDGLEYLFGLWGPLGPKGEEQFLPLWAHDRAEEKREFERLIDLFTAHFKKYPRARIYHYAPYEPSAMKRLAMRHATREAALDDLLRDNRFVDLYQIVRQGVRASTEGYSLKDLEKIYWGKRDGEVTNAAASIVEYERWRLTGDKAILDAISHYNKADCLSTVAMRDWLAKLRPARARYAPISPSDGDKEDRQAKRTDLEARKQAVAAQVRASALADERVRNLVAEMLWFHQRAQKPEWWAAFERQTWSDEQLIDDIESIGAIELDMSAPLAQEKQSFIATYSFPPQDTKLREGAAPRFALTLEPAGTIVELDAAAGFLRLKRSRQKGEFPEHSSLLPPKPIDQGVLAEAVLAFAERVAAEGGDRDQAMIDLLARALPRFHDRPDGAPVVADGADLIEGTKRAAGDLDDSYLFIQGPPGTGKTYTTARVIVELLKRDKRVAVSSNSHRAIGNLLEAVEERATEVGFSFAGAKKASDSNEDSAFDGDFIETVWKSEHVGAHHALVGGTAFHFARSDQRGAYDYLVVDEAGQVALGNLIAMSGCAKNIILVGDQMQLPQPVQGVHPEQTGLSCLDYLLEGQATVAAERGILLNVTRRLHPLICEFISDSIYDGRLSAHPSTMERRLVLGPDADPALKPAGLSTVLIDHEGCSQSSVEEVEVVARLYRSLLKQCVTDQGGKVRALTAEDVLVVAPYNMQVGALAAALPSDARVGTVDKFQGQEAAVVIVSFATSSAAEAPRGLEFLLNRNRLNVAVSRAQSLAVLVHSPKLLHITPTAVADLQRLSLIASANRLSSLQSS